MDPHMAVRKCMSAESARWPIRPESSKGTMRDHLAREGPVHVLCQTERGGGVLTILQVQPGFHLGAETGLIRLP